MKKLLAPAAIVFLFSLATSAIEAGEPCGPECFEVPTSRWQRLRDRLTLRRHASWCGQGKTHLDMGCTGCRADCVFVFGNCCEYFDQPELYRGPLDHLRGWRK